MAKQLELKGRNFWILSEPAPPGWRAWVVESKGGEQEPIGIEATGDTRGIADDEAERKLRRLFQT